jgi:hypothetical protein
VMPSAFAVSRAVHELQTVASALSTASNIAARPHQRREDRLPQRQSSASQSGILQDCRPAACREVEMPKSEKSPVMPLLVLIAASVIVWAAAMTIHGW